MRKVFLIMVIMFFSIVVVANDWTYSFSKSGAQIWSQKAQRGSEHDDNRYTKDQIERSILWLMSRHPRERILNDEAWRKRFVDAFYDIGERYNVPSLLLSFMAYRESKFNTKEVGSLGEIGVLQVGKQGRRACREECGPMDDSPEVQICHGGCWLDKIDQHCGKRLFHALNGYAGGRCYPKGSQTVKAVDIRYYLWAMVHLISEESEGVDDVISVE